MKAVNMVLNSDKVKEYKDINENGCQVLEKGTKK